MAKANPHPLFSAPGPDFAKIKLREAHIGGPFYPWLRIHHKNYGAIYFSQAGRSRWDSPVGPFGTMCVGESLAGIVLERFGDQLRGNGRFLSYQEICDYHVTEIDISMFFHGFRVADICDSELFRIGADSQLFSGAYSVSQQWSVAFMKHPQSVAGIRYNSRHDPSRPNLVLFNRPGIETILKAGRTVALKDHQDFKRVINELRIGITPPTIAPAEDLP